MPALNAELDLQDNRAVDSIKGIVPANIRVRDNDTIECYIDDADMDNLVGFYNFRNGLEDGSWNGNDLRTVLSDIPEYVTDDKIPWSVLTRHEGDLVYYDTGFIIPDGRIWEVNFWVRIVPPVSGSVQFLHMHGGPHTTNIRYNSRDDTVEITHPGLSSAFTFKHEHIGSGAWHHIRYTHTPTGGGCWINGRRFFTLTENWASQMSPISKAVRFTGSNQTDVQFAGIRVYSKPLNEVESSNTDILRVPKSIAKFAGRVTRVENNIVTKEFQAFSWGYRLAVTDVKNEVFEDRTASSIMRELVEKYTDLTPTDIDEVGTILYSRYDADGKLIDILNELALEASLVFYTDYKRRFYLERIGVNESKNTYIHGQKCIIANTGADDKNVRNRVVIGGAQRSAETDDDGNPITESTFSSEYRYGRWILDPTPNPHYDVSQEWDTTTEYVFRAVLPPDADSSDIDDVRVVFSTPRSTKARPDTVSAPRPIARGYRRLPPAWTRPTYPNSLYDDPDSTIKTRDLNHTVLGDTVEVRMMLTAEEAQYMNSAHDIYFRRKIIVTGADGQARRANVAHIPGQFRMEFKIKRGRAIDVSVSDEESINKYGLREQRVALNAAYSEDSAQAFASAFLYNHSQPRYRSSVVCKRLLMDVNVNDTVWIINGLTKLRQIGVVRKIIYKYPESQTTLLVGEHRFTDYDIQADVQRALHQIESAVDSATSVVCHKAIVDRVRVKETIRIETLPRPYYSSGYKYGGWKNMDDAIRYSQREVGHSRYSTGVKYSDRVSY